MRRFGQLHKIGLSNDQLMQRGVEQFTADCTPGLPNRVELRDATRGESVLLLNFTRRPADTPYRSSRAILAGEGATAHYATYGYHAARINRD